MEIDVSMAAYSYAAAQSMDPRASTKKALYYTSVAVTPAPVRVST
jgi:hypothetical protein